MESVSFTCPSVYSVSSLAGESILGYLSLVDLYQHFLLLESEYFFEGNKTQRKIDNNIFMKLGIEHDNLLPVCL